MLKLVLLLAFLVAIAVAQEVAWNGTLHDRGKRVVEGQRCALSRARAPFVLILLCSHCGRHMPAVRQLPEDFSRLHHPRGSTLSPT